MDDDNKQLDLPTDRVITEYTQKAMAEKGTRLTTANILRPVARALGNLAASLNVPLSTVFIEVTSAYEDFVGKATARTQKPPRRRVKPAKVTPVPVGIFTAVLEGRPNAAVVHYQSAAADFTLTVPRDIVPVMIEAGLVGELCDCGAHHPQLAENASLIELEAHRARVAEFIQSRTN